MCLYIRNNFPNPFIADKDIICYKLLESGMVSPFMNFKYKKRKVYTTELFILESNSTPWKKSYKAVLDGFHSYSRLLSDNKKYAMNFYVAIIPKGSTFYYDDLANELASNSIKIIGKVGYFHRFLLYLHIIKPFSPEKEKEIEKMLK